MIDNSVTPGTGPVPARAAEWSTVWTRGEGCEDLARLLAEGEPVRVEGGLRDACVAARAMLLVTGKLTSFDLVRSVVPNNLHLTKIGSVVAAVGSGPHSVLAAKVAARLAERLGVEGSIVSVSPDEAQDAETKRALARIAAEVPGVPHSVIREPNARGLVNDLPPDAALVVGAPGGSWLQRQFFGPGHQLVVRARAGAIVVRDVPRRCFQQAVPPDALGSGLLIADARLLATQSVTAVVDNGALVGIVRSSALDTASAEATVDSVMEDAVFLRTDDPIDAAEELFGFMDGSPIPVVDAAGNLFGSIIPPD
jgi:hypothetical protein